MNRTRAWFAFLFSLRVALLAVFAMGFVAVPKHLLAQENITVQFAPVNSIVDPASFRNAAFSPAA